MGMFDFLDDIFDPIGSVGDLFGGANGGFNNALDMLDPGNTFHQGSSKRNALAQQQFENALAQQNYDEQVRMNDWNIKQQEEAYNYQKTLNEQMRQDSLHAVENRVADLKAAGLSPTLAAGSAASVPTIHAGTAPQGVAPQKQSRSAIATEQAMFQEGMLKDRLGLAISAMGNMANISRTKAETSLLEAEKNQKDVFIKYYEDLLRGQVLGQSYDNDLKALTYQFQKDTYSDRADEIKKNVELITSKIDVNKVEQDLKKNEAAYKVYLSAKTQLESQKLGIQISTEATKALAEAYTYQWFSSRNLPIGNVSDHALLMALFAAGQQQAHTMPIASDGKPVIGNIPVRDGHGTTLPSGRKSYGIADIIDAVTRGLNFLNSPSYGQ